MQSKASKNTRSANQEEKNFASWVKEQPCCVCGNHGPSIVQHCFGKSFKHNKVLVGHWFIIPLCPACDEVDTKGSHKAFREAFGPQSALWLKLIEKSPFEPPVEVEAAIKDWNR